MNSLGAALQAPIHPSVLPTATGSCRWTVPAATKCPRLTSERTEGFMQNLQTFRRAFLLAIGGILTAGAVSGLRAQAPATDTTKPLAFEVASVKPSKSGDVRVVNTSQPGGRYLATNITLRQL